MTAAAFAPILRNGFIDLDDHVNLVDNPWIRGFGAPELRWMLTTFHSGHWQPLTWLSFALDYRLWGTNPVGYHLTSLLLHATNAALFFLLARRLLVRAGASGAGEAAAAVAALLWAVHPLRVESVAWATQRHDLLSGLFVLLALLAYTRAPGSRGGLLRTLVAAGLAVLCKASAMVLPALLVVLDVYPLRRLGGEHGWTGPAVRRVWIEKIPFLIVAGVAAVVASIASRHSGALRPLSEIPIAARIGAVMYGVGFYLWKTVLPLRLLPLYEYPLGFGPLHPAALAGLATAIVAAAGAILLRHRCPAVAAALIAYLAAIAPTLGLLQSGPQVAADRYTYLASLGWAVVVGGLLLGRPGRARAIAGGVLVVLLGLLASVQATTWRDARTLWSRVVAIEPTNAFALKSMGDADLAAGNLDGAIAWYQRATAIRSYSMAETQLAGVLARRGRYDEAFAHYGAALRADPGDAFAYTSYGATLAERGRLEEALAAHRHALAINPDLMEAHANLGNALHQAGRGEEAMHEYEVALRLRPSAEVYNNIGVILLKANRPADAATSFRRALALREDLALLHENLGRALAAGGDRAGARLEYERALQLDAGLPGARAGLAALGAVTP